MEREAQTSPDEQPNSGFHISVIDRTVMKYMAPGQFGQEIDRSCRYGMSC